MASEAQTLRALSLAMIIQFAIGGCVLPFVTIFLQDRGLDYRQISHIFALSSATLLVVPFVWGMLADRYLPLERVFTLLNLLVLAALFSLSRQSSFIGCLLSMMLFLACFNPTMMLINSLCFHHLHRPREQFGLLRAWGSFGWMVPSVPIFLWLTMRESQDLTFTLHGGMGLCVVMAVWTFWLPHTPPKGRGSAMAPGSATLGYWAGLKQLLRNPSYVVIILAFILMAGSFSIFIVYSPPQLAAHGMDRKWIGLVPVLGILLEILLFRWRSLFIYRWSYVMTLSVGCLAMALRHLLFAFVDNLWVLSFSFLLVGMVIVFFNIAASVLVNSIAPPEVRSTAQSTLVLCGAGLGPMIANGVIGLLAGESREDLERVFLFAALLCVAAFLLILGRGSRLDQDAGEATPG